MMEENQKNSLKIRLDKIEKKMEKRIADRVDPKIEELGKEIAKYSNKNGNGENVKRRSLISKLFKPKNFSFIPQVTKKMTKTRKRRKSQGKRNGGK